MATAAESKSKVSCPCPLCGATEGLSVRVHDLVVTCTECGDDVGRRELVAMIESAERLLKWLDLAETV
jgi:hypothetical protein